jgi:hypothetical protein
MTSEEIKNTDFYKSLSKLSNDERGVLFERYTSKVEDILKVKLIKHSYTELGNLNTGNPMISYRDGSVIAIMEFSIKT